MKYNTFRSMNPMYGREKIFQINLNYNAKFPFQMSMQTIIHQMKMLYVSFSNTSTISKI
jgi:hypothetical protein